MLYVRALALALALLDPAEALLPQCCASRVASSRVSPLVSRTAAVPCMCDAAVAEPPAEETSEEPAPARPRRVRAPKTKLEELEVGQEMQGTIRSVQAYGAFVDVGAATDGLLHVSEISNEFIKDATEKLNVGDTITVRIKNIDTEKNQLAFTAKDESAPRKERAPRGPKVDLSKYLGADEKEFITGKVSRVQEYGAFIEIEPGVDGLVHISQIQDGGVSSVEEVLTAGQEVQVRIIKVEPDKRRIGLSMRPWVAEEDRPQRKPRGGGGGDFGDDKEFQLSADELAAMAGGDAEEELMSPFDAAFARLEMTQAAKKEGKKFAHRV